MVRLAAKRTALAWALAGAAAAAGGGCGGSRSHAAGQPRESAPAATSGTKAPVGPPTSSTPSRLELPQLGFVAIRCDRSAMIQPMFLAAAGATEEVTLRGGTTSRSGSLNPRQGLTLPFGLYSTVTWSVSQATEPHDLKATVTATFVRHGVPRYACYVSRWSVDMVVRPH